MSWLIRQVLSKIEMGDLKFIKENIKFVRGKISTASSQRTPELTEIFPNPRLVAVSKTKPKECVIEAYNVGERHFGENYVQELVDKALDEEVRNTCPDIKWHFIGHLQKNKISKVLSAIDNLFVIETIDSETLAKSLNDALQRRKITKPLNIMIQVNTSGEDAKSGVQPEKCADLVNYVLKECPNLKFIGLMTIGLIGASTSDDAEPNKDFQCLFNLREKVCAELHLERSQVELSMGMSSDFESAIQLGSTNVRIGSTIFGARQAKPTVANVDN